MLENGPVVEVDAVIGTDRNIARVEQIHDLARRIAPGKGGVLLAQFRGPVAQPDMRLEIDHRCSASARRDAFDGLGRIIMCKESRIPIGHVHVDQHMRIRCLMPRAPCCRHAWCHTCFRPLL